MNAFVVVALAIAAQVAPHKGVLLDGVAAVVEREVISRSDVERAARVQLARRGGGVEAASSALDEGLLRAVLDLLIVEELVLLDARRAQNYPESDEDVAREVARVKARLPSESAFQEFLRLAYLPEADFVEMMRRQARVERMIAERMKLAPLSDDEVRTALQQRPDLGNAAQARAFLEHMHRGEAAVAYVNELRRRTSVKVVARYEPVPADAGTNAAP